MCLLLQIPQGVGKLHCTDQTHNISAGLKATRESTHICLMSSQPYMEYLDYIACLNILMHRLLIVLWQFLQALFVKLPLYKTPPPSLSVLVAHPVQLSQVVVMPMRQCVCFHSPTKVCNTTNASLLTTMDNYGVQQLPTMTLIICGAIVRVCVFF